MKNDIHIIPNEDLYDHCETVRCPCKPKYTLGTNGKLLITHNSFDRRELFEPDRDLSFTEHLERLALLPKVALNRLWFYYLKWRLERVLRSTAKVIK